MKINFSSQLFNPLYWHLKKYMADQSIRYILVYGGSSAAKTYTLVQRCLVDSLEERDSVIVLRKYGSDIEDSIYSDFTGIISTWDLEPLFITIKHKIRNTFGGYIRFRGLDDAEKIKGIARFKRVIMEEMTQFDNEDFKQIRKRLRGRAGQQVIGLWNPVSEEHWIKKEIIDRQTWIDLPTSTPGEKYSQLSSDSFIRINEDKNTILIRTTYQDNYWIVGHPANELVGFKDDHVLADFLQDKKFDYPYYQVYALGEWGKLDTGAEFYKGFSPVNNVGEAVYDSSQPLHISWDENVNPYVSLTIWQARGNHVRLIDEIAMESPRNTLQHVLTEFIKRYYNHEGGLFIYGDASSRKADVKLEKGYNFFTIAAQGLKQFNPQIRVPLSNPSVMVRGMFINQLFQGRFPGYQVTIGVRCKHTIEDLRYVKEASDGSKLKEKEKDPKTLVTFEKYGHLSDTVDYFLTMFWAGKFNEFQHGDSTAKRMALKAREATNF
jgi:phage terminase large subunit